MSDGIDPRDLAAITDLELAARLIAEGYLFGRHHGHRLGAGTEFAQYRSWEPGESSRLIDWRLFARTDRLFVREAELETDFRLWLLLDTSASMSQRSEQGHLSKFQSARLLAAALGFVAQRQDDEMGLIEIGDIARVRLPAEAGRRQWYRLLALLEQLIPLGQVQPTDHLPANLLEVTQGSLIVALSDFYQRDGEWVELLKRLATGNREVLALCLECQDEIDLGHQGAVRFEDLESGNSVLSIPDEVRISYRERREDWLQETEHQLQGSGIQFARFNVDQPMDLALRSLLTMRMRAA
jgi:uncharacterized protein (DUF58 family)